MSDRYYLTDGGHVLISGATGAKAEYGGKTTTANWWFEQSVECGWHDVGLFYNPKGHDFIRGERVDSLRELAEAYRSGTRLFNYCPPVSVTDQGALEEQHGEIVETLRQLPGEKIVVHDEAQSYPGPALNWCLAQGGNLDEGSMRSLLLTQRPWNMPEELLANMPVKIWVGPVTSEGRRFFKTWEMGGAIAQVEEDTGPYHWAVTDGGEYQHTNPPVPEEYAHE
jgi:hypothetical protein